MGLYDDLVPTEAEKKLIDAAARGEACDFTDGGDNNPANGVSWGPERTVRAEVIVALATLARPDWPVAAKGVRLLGAKIAGALDFVEATLECSLWLQRCHVGETIALRRARARTVALQGCFLKPQAGRAIEANGLRCDGDLFLRASKINGEVFLLGARIGTDLVCGDATFAAAEGGDGKAFSADGMTVKGNAFLENIKAKGEVGLLGARIGGDLDCEGATLAAAKGGNGYAFSADRVTVEGTMILRTIQAKGEVRLLGTIIGGNLACQGATFAAADGSDGRAFSADRMAITGNVFLENVRAEGEVRLLGARIGGDLGCQGATFAAADGGKGRTFNADGMTVEGALFWRDIESVSGIFELTHATVGQLVDDAASWQGVSALYIDGFEYGAFAGRAPTDFRPRLAWLAKMPKRYFWPQPYEQLAKVLRQMGHEHDARKIAIAKQDAYRDQGQLSWYHKLWLWVFRGTVRYGYEPWRALGWTIVCIIVGAFLFYQAFEAGVMHPSKERVFMNECYTTPDFDSMRRIGKCEGWKKIERSRINKPFYLPADYPRFQSIVYAVDVFLPFVDLHQESYWLPSDKHWWPWMLIYFWAHIAVGWFLATMFIVGFTNIVKKD